MNRRFIKYIVTLLVVVLSISVFAGCVRIEDDVTNENQNNSQNDTQQTEETPKPKYPMEITDKFGNKVTINSLPQRIISLAPSHTEILFALGLGSRVVGVSNYCDYPVEAQQKEKIGDSLSVNVERIIELNPDLVVQYGEGNEEANKKLRDAGIALLSYEPESIDEVLALILELGNITDTMRAATMKTVDMQSKLEYIKVKVSKAEKPNVFYEVWHEPIMTAGPGSFIDELITLAGGQNIASDAEGKYPQFDMEQLILRNPDVYLTAQDSPDKTVESIKAREGYEAIKAVQNNRIYILEPNIISRPGPRIIDGLELIAKSIHPELFTK